MKVFVRKLAGDLKYVSLGALVLMVMLFLSPGCMSSFDSYVDDYRLATKILGGNAKFDQNAGESSLTVEEYNAAKDRNFALFKQMFADLKKADIDAIVHEAYAQDMYFNDTIRTIYSADQYADYLQKTAATLNKSQVEFTEVAMNDQSYFLCWVMTLELEALGQEVMAESIGMSQIRFNNEGKIVFHQDFWDNNQGIFGHLPYVGELISNVRSRL